MQNPKSEIRVKPEIRNPNYGCRAASWSAAALRRFATRKNFWTLPPSPRGLAQSKTWLVALCFLLSALCFPVWGQYAIDWFTIDGGGGTSTGAVYSVSGTIGQPDAGPPAHGGGYILQSGFWSVIAAVQTPAAPFLAIARTTTNTVVVSWPQAAEGWVLQANTNSISSINWSDIPSGIQDDGTTKSLTVNPPAGNRFYRLMKP